MDAIGELTQEEREQLKARLGDLVKDTPAAELAVPRNKRLLRKAGQGVANHLRSFIVDVASETVKKALLRDL